MIGPVITSLIPVALLIALGHFLRRRAVITDGFWSQAEWLGYHILLPALFFHGLATADLGGLPMTALAWVLGGSILVAALGLVLARPWLGIDGPGFTSIFQGGIRFNSYVAVSVATSLFGAQGVALSAVCNAIIVPLVNVLCVLVFIAVGPGGVSLGAALRGLGRNPLLMSCLAGIIFQGLGLSLPRGLALSLKALGQASLPLGLLCVGAALDLSGVGRWIKPLAAASTVKFLALPALTITAIGLVGLSGAPATVAVLFHSMPTATSSYVLARQLGGDARLMAGIIAGQTILAGLAVPVIAMVMSMMV